MSTGDQLVWESVVREKDAEIKRLQKHTLLLHGQIKGWKHENEQLRAALEPFSRDAVLMKDLLRYLHGISQGVEIQLERICDVASQALNQQRL